MIRSARDVDAAAIAALYNPYVTHTTVSFEEQPVTSQDMQGRLAGVAAARLPWLVAEAAGEVVGYAYASPWKTRAAYRFSVETSVYLQRDAGRRGLGSQLYEALLEALGACGVHAVIAGIALPNKASVALHEKFGLRKVAHFEQVGFKFGRWIDVGYWQKQL